MGAGKPLVLLGSPGAREGRERKKTQKTPLCSNVIRGTSDELAKTSRNNEYVRWEVVGFWLVPGLLGFFLLSFLNRKGTALDCVVQPYRSDHLQAEAQRSDCYTPRNIWGSSLGEDLLSPSGSASQDPVGSCRQRAGEAGGMPIAPT